MISPLRPGAIETDAVIVGAGPVGLFQAFQLGLQEIHTHIIDALPHAGGQCVELYADKPIYDIPGVPVCTGRSLVDNLLQQLQPIPVQFHLGQLVSGVVMQADGRLLVETSKGTQFLTRTLFIAAGVGAFQPKMPAVEGLAQYLGRQIYTAFDATAAWAGQQVLILGDTDAALSAAISLAQSPARPQSITLMHRREVFAAEAETITTFQALVQSGALHFLAGQPSGFMDLPGHLQRHLTGMRYIDSNGKETVVSVDALLILQGLSPKLGPIAHWGLDMERRQLTVNTETFATSVSPIFAVGDIVTYPGKKKLILCGFHECVMAAFAAAALIFPGKKVLLEYTTTSSRLHKLLGVNSARPL